MMKVRIFWLYGYGDFNSNANVDDGSCFFSPFGPEPDTDCNATILIPADVNITIDEQPIPWNLDWSVYSNSSNELSYGGGVEWNGEVTIAAWGAEGSETMVFKMEKYLHGEYII